MESYLYLIINLLSITPPFLLSFDKKVGFYKKWKFLFPSLFIVALPFLVWDVIFTELGIWGFNEKYLSGIYLINLPIEEVLFFFTIPYACVFTYEVLRVYIKMKLVATRLAKLITMLLVGFLFVIFVLYYERLYTSITFISLSLSLLILHFIIKFERIGQFYFSYLVILIPFTLVNGILTGSSMEEPVVWYNNAENINFRIFTIPFEDIFYGMLLILLNVFTFEKLQNSGIKNFFKNF